VVSTCRRNTELAAVIASCGAVVRPGDAPALADALARLADDPALRTSLGRAGRAHAEAHFELDGVLESKFGPLEAALAPTTADVMA
jgi:colanic acid biosynthesis glycosyl transferase WcaI